MRAHLDGRQLPQMQQHARNATTTSPTAPPSNSSSTCRLAIDDDTSPSPAIDNDFNEQLEPVSDKITHATASNADIEGIGQVVADFNQDLENQKQQDLEHIEAPVTANDLEHNNDDLVSCNFIQAKDKAVKDLVACNRELEISKRSPVKDLNSIKNDFF